MTIHPASVGHQPSHPGLFEVVWGKKGEFGSRLVAVKAFAKGTVIAPLANTQPTRTKAYSSVQVGPDPSPDGSPSHIELCSDLLYVNHSCDPNVAFEVPGGIGGQDGGRWKVRALKDIKRGDTLTFAYFSTEWDMAQPFDCKCGAETCLGTVSGARHVPSDVLDEYFVNEHILALKRGHSAHQNGAVEAASSQ